MLQDIQGVLSFAIHAAAPDLDLGWISEVHGVEEAEPGLAPEGSPHGLEGLGGPVMGRGHLGEADRTALFHGPQQHAAQGVPGIAVDPDDPDLPLLSQQFFDLPLQTLGIGVRGIEDGAYTFREGCEGGFPGGLSPHRDEDGATAALVEGPFLDPLVNLEEVHQGFETGFVEGRKPQGGVLPHGGEQGVHQVSVDQHPAPGFRQPDMVGHDPLAGQHHLPGFLRDALE
ncbi:MAG: hypothetical protein BWY56_01602 [Acidobacteria bacterium ADurb.Bin340]|nr:MAG: hypothetical protein BWY56_01602 [Acidobacteria bacterium ADurb.Bin340]